MFNLKRVKRLIKIRIKGPVARMVKEDVKSFFSSEQTTTYGFSWFFLGQKKHISAIIDRYYNKEADCLDINGVRLPTKGLCINCIRDVLGVNVYSRLGYSRIALEKIYPQVREDPYEHKEVVLEAGDIVIDAGAYTGIFSAFASKKLFREYSNGGGLIYAFEPIPHNIEILQETAALNEGIKVVPFALSDTVGVVDIHINKHENTNHSIVRKNSGDGLLQVKTTTLDNFVNENNLQKVDFIKADIEGAERLLLKGAKSVLKDYAPKISICTYHLPDDPQVLRELILDANQNYKIINGYKKMYAYVPKNNT